VIAEITRAFAGVRLDGGVTLHQARAIDDWESKERQLAVRDNDQERHWQEVTDEHSGLNSMAIYSITWNGDRSTLLNEEQGRAVCGFLRYLVAESMAWREEAQEAIDLCRGRFCP
jgi:hypothetical protein